MADITLLQECVLKVEEIKAQICDDFENWKQDMLGENSDEVNAPVAALLQPKVEMEEAEEAKPIASVYLFPSEEEQLEDPLAVDPLAGCKEWNEKKPLADTFLLRVKKEVEPGAAEETGTSNERSQEVAVEGVEDGRRIGGNSAESPSEKLVSPTPQSDSTHIMRPFACVLREHRKEPQLFICDTCNREFISRIALVTHSRVHCAKQKAPKHQEQEHREESQLLYGCSICERRFAHRSSLDSHKRRHKRFPCEICGKDFQRDYLKRHMLIHTEEKPYVCDCCGKKFPDRPQFNIHRRSHTGEKPYVCEHCEKGFTQMSALKLHSRTHTGEQPFSCSICNKRFAYKSTLVSHIKRHMNIRPYECRECGKTFVESKVFKQHLRTHTGIRPYKCNICSKALANIQSLNYHTLTHSQEQKHV